MATVPAIMQAQRILATPQMGLLRCRSEIELAS